MGSELFSNGSKEARAPSSPPSSPGGPLFSPLSPARPPTRTDGKSAEDRQQKFMRLRATRVRLIISIPTLLLLMTLAAGFVSYQIVLDSAERQSALARLAPTHATAQQFLNTQALLEKSAEKILRAALLVSLTAAIFGLVLAIQIVRPIRELTETTRQMVYGDLSRRPRIPHLGEFADLGMTFNRMVEHLQKLSRERNRIIEEGSQGTVIWLDFSGRVKSLDGSSAALFHRPVEVMAGRPIFELIPDLARQPDFRRVFHKNSPVNPLERPLTSIIETSFDSRLPPLLLGLTLAMMRDERNTSIGYLLMVRNLSALRGLHEQMNRADRLAALGTFATGMAHEIRNPLASVKGMIQLLGESHDPKALSTYIERIVEEIGRMETLIGEVMDFAQPETIRPEPVDLERVMNEALEVAQSRRSHAASRIRVRKEFQPGLQAVLDLRRIHRALVNLIVNALEAADAEAQARENSGKGNAGEVEVVLKTEWLSGPGHVDRPVAISVLNVGAPIPAEDRERIFEPFYTTKPSGTGLGLPIAYQIVSANRGIVEVDCSGGLTAFRIRLPETPAEM